MDLHSYYKFLLELKNGGEDFFKVHPSNLEKRFKEHQCDNFENLDWIGLTMREIVIDNW